MNFIQLLIFYTPALLTDQLTHHYTCAYGITWVSIKWQTIIKLVPFLFLCQIILIMKC